MEQQGYAHADIQPDLRSTEDKSRRRVRVGERPVAVAVHGPFEPREDDWRSESRGYGSPPLACASVRVCGRVCMQHGRRARQGVCVAAQWYLFVLLRTD